MNKCVISFLLICVAFVADSLSIDSTFNRACDCGEGVCELDGEGKPKPCECTGTLKEFNKKCITCDCGEGVCELDGDGKPKPCECTGQLKEFNRKCITCDCGEGVCELDGEGKPKPCECTGQLKEFNRKCITCDCGDAECHLDDKGEAKPCVCGDKQKKDSNGICRNFDTTPGELSTRFDYLTSTPGELSTRFKYLTSTRGEFSTRSKSICDEDRNDCVNGAECIQLGNQRFCHCLKGTYGDKCQHMWDCDERYNLKCNYKNGEICAYNTTLEESECLCVESELQYDTEQGKCKKTCVVGNHDCENGAICKTVGNYGFCECRLGTTGHKCERVTDCDFMNCTNTTGGRCEYDRHLEIAKCVCDNGLKYDEHAHECREICIPQKNDCQNGAMCEKEGNYSFCRCIPRSYGHKCEIVDDCESQKVICNENSGARCGINMDFRGAECLCDNGLKYDEESLTCRETCNFYKNKCENGAHCNRIGAYLFCDCPPGYFGHRCEKFKDKGENSPILFILLCITSGFLLISTITLVTVFIKFRSRRNK